MVSIIIGVIVPVKVLLFVTFMFLLWLLVHMSIRIPVRVSIRILLALVLGRCIHVHSRVRALLVSITCIKVRVVHFRAVTSFRQSIGTLRYTISFQRLSVS